MLLTEYAIKWWFVIPPLITNIYTLHGETWTPEIVFSGHAAYPVSKTTLLSEHAVDFVFFSDEKVFTVASPVNLQDDHRVYAPSNVKKRDIAAERLLRCRPTFSSSLMVSVAVSKLGCTELFFVEPGVKVDGRYYREVLLQKRMLPVMRRIADDMYVFQQDSALAHHARETVQLLQHRNLSLSICGLLTVGI